MSWRAPSSCTRAAFDAELTRLLGDEARQIDAEVWIRRGAHWKATVSVARAQRTLELASCGEAQRTAALVIATALAPERAQPTELAAGTATAEPIADAPSSPAARSDEAAPERTQADERTRDVRAPEGEPRRRARADGPAGGLHLRAGGLLAAYSLPEVSGGPSLGIELERGALAGWIDARYLAPRRAADNDSLLRADLDLFVAALGTAWLWNVGLLAAGPSLELEAGVLRARGEGEVAERDRAAAWIAAALGARVDAHLYRRVGASLYAAASVPFLRAGVQLGDERPFYTTEPIGFRLGLVIRLAIGSTKARNDGQ